MLCLFNYLHFTDTSSLPFVLGEVDYPGLSASFGSSGNKVKFACRKGFKLRGARHASCEKGDLHFDDPGDVFPKCHQASVHHLRMKEVGQNHDTTMMKMSRTGSCDISKI
ncbi:hypothetical protein B566_EDAN013307 [Ephemera danica]|nr:hypothetical protein B566_EDAN013307 [Ephemera danica]